MASKTNAVRIVQQKKYPFKEAFYDYDPDDLNGMHAAQAIGFPPEQVFKTLVAKGNKNGILVFCLPVCCELDLKKAAKAANDKSVELVAVKDLLALTGYIRGGCSPIGMKKAFKTWMDESCLMHDTICFSGGKRGCQIEMKTQDFLSYTKAGTASFSK